MSKRAFYTTMYSVTFFLGASGIIRTIIEPELPAPERFLYIMLFSAPFLAILFSHIFCSLTEPDYEHNVAKEEDEHEEVAKKEEAKQTI